MRLQRFTRKTVVSRQLLLVTTIKRGTHSDQAARPTQSGLAVDRDDALRLDDPAGVSQELTDHLLWRLRLQKERRERSQSLSRALDE